MLFFFSVVWWILTCSGGGKGVCMPNYRLNRSTIKTYAHIFNWDKINEYENIWICYIIIVVNLLHVSVTFCDHLQGCVCFFFAKDIFQRQPSECTIIKYQVFSVWFIIYVNIWNTDKIICAKVTWVRSVDVLCVCCVTMCT
jgi:hypothetical protein